MQKKFLISAFIILFLVVIAFALNNILEIYEDEKVVYPSREARMNNYLAFDRWLAAEGHPVRALSTGSIYTLKNSTEKTILIQSDLFDWNSETGGYVETLAKEGVHFVICLYYNWMREETELKKFLNNSGIKEREDQSAYGYNMGLPSFDRSVHFAEPEDDSYFSIKDAEGLIRLIQYPLGKGMITVTGRPRFMTSQNLGSEANARLSWSFFEKAEAGSGVLFIRGSTRPQGFMGRIFEHGNFILIIISAVVLLITGFWSVIPVFGIVRKNTEEQGKILAERFLAEGRFLKSCGALEYYRNVYLKEINRKIKKQKTAQNDEMLKEALSMFENEKDGLNKQAPFKKPLNGKIFFESVVILKKILERFNGI